MRKLRVLVMMDKALVPPDSIEGMSEAEIAPFKTEFDVVTGLRELGHDVFPVGVKTDLGVLAAAITRFRPHVCFNLVEDFHGIPSRDQHVVSYLELMNQPYTGSNPRGLTLARDKALTKKILSYHGISCPKFAEFPLGKVVRRPESLAFPLLVKSQSEEGSVGISQASIVYDDEQLSERVGFLHEKHGTDVIAEQYIEGRELYVSIMGNRKLVTFPIWELCLDHLPDASARIATAKVKWDEEYRKRHKIRSGAAKVSALVEERIQDVARHIYRLLDLSGYARLDLRLDAQGEVYLIEANPNPQIARSEDFADSAAAAGVGYEELLQRIVNLGLSYQPVGMAA